MNSRKTSGRESKGGIRDGGGGERKRWSDGGGVSLAKGKTELKLCSTTTFTSLSLIVSYTHN